MEMEAKMVKAWLIWPRSSRSQQRNLALWLWVESLPEDLPNLQRGMENPENLQVVRRLQTETRSRTARRVELLDTGMRIQSVRSMVVAARIARKQRASSRDHPLLPPNHIRLEFFITNMGLQRFLLLRQPPTGTCSRWIWLTVFLGPPLRSMKWRSVAPKCMLGTWFLTQDAKEHVVGHNG